MSLQSVYFIIICSKENVGSDYQNVYLILFFKFYYKQNLILIVDDYIEVYVFITFINHVNNYLNLRIGLNIK